MSRHKLIINLAHLQHTSSTTTHPSSRIIVVIVVQTRFKTHLRHLGQDRLPLIEFRLGQQESVMAEGLAGLCAVLERLQDPVFRCFFSKVDRERIKREREGG